VMKVYKQVFKLGLNKSLQYRANYYLGLVSIIFPLVMQIFLWTGMFAAADGKYVFGYTFQQMLMYAFFACLLAKIISVNYVYEINEDIKNGGLAKYIVRPINYRLYIFFGYLGEKVSMFLCSFVFILLVYVIGNLSADCLISATRFAVFFIILCLSVILNFLIYYAVSGLGFWMRDASGVIFITTLVGNIISGGIFPLDIFPLYIQRLLKILPFAYTNYFSTSILCGTIRGKDIGAGLFMQLLWIVICWKIGEIVWKHGMKIYTAVGG
jgi:ABC-2 type transport system permease protein